jgi:WD40 repeat protein
MDRKTLVVGNTIQNPQPRPPNVPVRKWPSDIGTIVFRGVEAAKEEEIRSGIAGCVDVLCFSPNGKLLAAGGVAEGGRSGQVRLWDASTHQELAVWNTNRSSVKHLTFSADGQLLAGAGKDSVLFVWETATKKQRHILAGHTDQLNALVFASDKKHLVSIGAMEVRWWDANSGDTVSIKDNRGSGWGLPGPNGRGAWIMRGAADGPILGFLDFASQRETALVTLRDLKSIQCMAASADGSVLAIGEKGEQGRLNVHLWPAGKLLESKSR